jgi:uncharacterized protein
MPPEFLAPGVYVQEIPSGVRTITGVSTSIAAFVGRTVSGPIDTLTLIRSPSDFERTCGGLSLDCPLSYAVQHFFLNGGSEALIARIVHRDASGADDESAPITDADIADPALESRHRGLWLLDQADLVNILCIPPLSRTADVMPSTWNTAIAYAKSRRAFVIIDPPSGWTTAAQATTGVDRFVNRDADAALYFPRMHAADPLRAGLLETFAPCGAVAGVYARTDATRGVWKAPAGVDATLRGVHELDVNLTEPINSQLNTAAVNCLRTFPTHGHVVWGARTLAGVDAPASEWKYVPVRRLALYIEESIARGTAWAAFEPNVEPLWAQLRLDIGAFLHSLFRAGAFQGRTPLHAYFVKCDATTTTSSDVGKGVVNILIGFAPLKPAEFVILRIQQLAGQGQA